MLWLYCSAYPSADEGGYFTRSNDFYLPSLRLQEGGGGQHPVANETAAKKVGAPLPTPFPLWCRAPLEDLLRLFCWIAESRIFPLSGEKSRHFYGFLWSVSQARGASIPTKKNYFLDLGQQHYLNFAHNNVPARCFITYWCFVGKICQITLKKIHYLFMRIGLVSISTYSWLTCNCLNINLFSDVIFVLPILRDCCFCV